MRPYIKITAFLLMVAASSVISAASETADTISDEQLAKLVSSSDLLVLNFWATWCVPCVEEIPVFAKAHRQFSKAKVVGVSMDEPERGDLVQKFGREHRIEYPIALWTGQNFEKMVNSIDPGWNGPIPATFIFKKGKRVFSKIGQVSEAELLNALKKFD